MKSRVHLAILAILSFAGIGGCSGSSSSKSPVPAGSNSPQLVVRRGNFSERLVLTGELAASRSDNVTVPQVPTWQIGIKWMVPDGAEVRKGEKLVELDNSSVSGDLEEKRLAEINAHHGLAGHLASAQAVSAEKRFDLERKEIELEKTRIEASIPRELRPRREHEDKQLALEKAKTEFAKAKTDLEAFQKSTEAETAIRQLAFERAAREIRTAEKVIEELVLRAPRDGIVVIGDHPWEGRKLQVGDTIWVGLPVARLPDLTTLQIEASLSDVDDGRIEVGQNAVALVDAYPETKLTAKIAQIAPVAQEAANQSLRRGFRVVAKLDQVDVDRMRPGLSVKLEVLREGGKDVVLAPRGGLDLTSTPPRAFLASGRAADVTLGPCNMQECVVLGGLTAGSRLVAARTAKKGS